MTSCSAYCSHVFIWRPMRRTHTQSKNLTIVASMNINYPFKSIFFMLFLCINKELWSILLNEPDVVLITNKGGKICWWWIFDAVLEVILCAWSWFFDKFKHFFRNLKNNLSNFKEGSNFMIIFIDFPSFFTS